MFINLLSFYYYIITYKFLSECIDLIILNPVLYRVSPTNAIIPLFIDWFNQIKIKIKKLNEMTLNKYTGGKSLQYLETFFVNLFFSNGDISFCFFFGLLVWGYFFLIQRRITNWLLRNICLKYLSWLPCINT